MKKLQAGLLFGISGVFFGSCNAHAQVKEIVVTATKKSENVQDISISVAALDSEALTERGISDGYDLGNVVPNLVVQTVFGPGAPPYIALRGINYQDSNFINENPVGVYIDDVYQGDVGASVGQVFDQERVEVLRGPQGTLFGRNTPVGAIHFISHKPELDFGGYANLEVGSWRKIIAQGAINLPVSDSFRVRFAGKYDTDNGVRRNAAIPGSRFGKADILGLRGIAQIDLTDTLMAEFGVSYTRNRSTIGGQIGLGKLDPVTGRVCSPADIQAGRCVTNEGFRNANPSNGVIYSDQREIPNYSNALNGYAKFNWNLGDFEVVSITGLGKVDRLFAYESDNVARVNATRNILIRSAGEHHQFSQELRVSNDAGPLKWIIGAFYYEDEKQASSAIDLGSGTATAPFVRIQFADATIKSKAWALFGQASLPLGTDFTLVGGLRYSDDKRELVKYRNSGGVTSPVGIPKVSEGVLIGRASIEWRPAQDVMLYAQYSGGSKSGGFNTGFGVTPTTLGLAGPTKGERVNNFEIGLRSQFFDNKLQANLTGFYMPYRNLQVQANVIDPATNLFVSRFFNLDKSIVYGAEMEFQFVPSNSFDAMLGVGLLNTEIKDSQGLFFRSDLPGSLPGSAGSLDFLDGNVLPSAPKLSFNWALRYHYNTASAGIFTAQADGRYQSKIWVGPDNNPNEYQNSYALLNLRLRWASKEESYSVEAYAENVFDRHYAGHVFDSGADFIFRTPGYPRKFGIRFGLNF